MGGDDRGLIIRKARVFVNDYHRGVFLHRGMFVKAPPSFFEFYGSDFTNLSQKDQQDLHKNPNIKLRMFPSGWNSPEPQVKVEVPPPAPTVISETVLSAPAAVAETVAEAAPAKDEVTAESTAVKPKKKSRKVVIR